MTVAELILWQKIQSFEFNKPSIKLTFTQRLARENNFSEHFSNQVIEEYKKFIFLCCVSQTHITPSHFVDLAWHLHLTYTKSYWIDLCQNTIERQLHHNPTEGGKSENAKFKNLYNDTLKLYSRYFETKAPKEIWQDDTIRFQHKITNIDPTTNWVIPKTNWSNIKPRLSFVLLAICFSLFILGCRQSDQIAIPIVIVIVLALIYIIWLINKYGPYKSSENNSGSGCSSTAFFDSSTTDHSHHSDSSDSSSSDSGGDSGCSSGCSGCGGGGD
jgi:hypothetical protein